MSEIQGLTETIPPAQERRVHERRRVSLAYIDLGENNGGIVLNVSEGGLAVTAVEVLHGAHIPKMRFQLPHSHARIEARGQIAWTGESKREVGVRFVDLSAEAATEIKSWIASEFAGEAANGAAQQQYPSERDAGWRESYAADGELSSTGMAPGEPSENFTDTSNDKITPAGEVTHTSLRRPFTAIMAPEMIAREPAALEFRAPELPAPEMTAPEMSMPEPFVPTMPLDEMKAHVPLIDLTAAVQAPAEETASPAVETPAPAAETVVPVVETPAPAAATEAPAIEMTAPELPPVIELPAPAIELPQYAQTPSGNDAVTGRSFTAALQKTKAPVEFAPPNHSVLRLNDEPQIFYQAWARAHGDEFVAPHRRWWALTALISLFAVVSFVAGMAAGGGGWDGVLRLAGGKSTPTGEAATGAAAEAAAGRAISAAPGAENTTANPADAKSAGRGSASDRNPSSTSARPGDKENSSIELSMPESTVTASASIAIISRRSVQVTEESAPKSSLQGGSVQIGQLFYRVEPFYPPDAERQGIEGAVEVHAVVGRDGKVRAAEAVSGPSALAEPAVKAVREWRYKPTTVNGQAIESEVIVKMIFRLPHDKNNPQ